MIFKETPLAGAYVVEAERIADERGFFARTYSRAELAAHGLDPDIAQCSVSFNHRRGTLRGLHFQAEPFAEVKLVRCTRGSIWDVIVDIRDGSPTRGRHAAAVLSAEARNAFYIPKGFAHGFLTLEDDAEVFYQISAPYSPQHARGFRWDDPAFAIPWPEAPAVISDRDRDLPVFS